MVGGGRMGLPLACTFAKHGAEVVVCDVDRRVVAAVEQGRSPYEEPGLPELMADLHQSGRLHATTVTAEGVSGCDGIVVIVPAHLTPDREIDFAILKAASADVGRGMSRNALVVYETTVSVGGTRRQLIPILEQQSGLRAGKDFFVAYSPERVKANLVLKRLETTPKVIGGLDATSLERAHAMYGKYLGAPIDQVGTIEAAEMTKLLGMLYRDVNIALANELAAFCELANVDFDRVRAAANSDGEANLLLPGIGVGGHCTPVYPYFLTRESRRLGMTQRISEAAREINDDQPARHLDRVAAHWRALRGVKAHILGLGFRPGVKVDTYSPAYTLRDELERRGAVVTIEDPYYSEQELSDAGFLPGLAKNAELIVLNTAHEQFANPPFSTWKAHGIAAVLDGRNFWRQAEIEASDLLYFGVGRASEPERRAAVKRSSTPLAATPGDAAGPLDAEQV